MIWWFLCRVEYEGDEWQNCNNANNRRWQRQQFCEHLRALNFGSNYECGESMRGEHTHKYSIEKQSIRNHCVDKCLWFSFWFHVYAMSSHTFQNISRTKTVNCQLYVYSPFIFYHKIAQRQKRQIGMSRGLRTKERFYASRLFSFFLLLFRSFFALSVLFMGFIHRYYFCCVARQHTNQKY